MENRWISVQEALPEQDMPVWVTVNDPDGNVCVQEANYYYDSFKESNGFVEYIDCTGQEFLLFGVIAWMPMFVPEPYTEN